jgi:hypothetical protein
VFFYCPNDEVLPSKQYITVHYATLNTSFIATSATIQPALPKYHHPFPTPLSQPSQTNDTKALSPIIKIHMCPRQRDHSFDSTKARADLAACGKGTNLVHNTRVSDIVDCSRTHLATVAPNGVVLGEVRNMQRRMQAREATKDAFVLFFLKRVNATPTNRCPQYY